ncbi:MAG: GEVED domain-containing protein [Bacteroidales bacterium]
MKKLSLLCVSLLMFGLVAKAQPTQIALEGFESGIPTGWVASSNAQIVTSLASRGNQSVRLKSNVTAPGSQPTTLTSPLYTRNAGCNVRLEFSHIPMLKNPEGAGQVEISFDNGTNWYPLTNSTNVSPNSYDATYGGGAGTGWLGYFASNNYSTDWGTSNTPETSLNNSYWRHEIFYLNKAFADYSNNSNSFKIRFKINSCVANNIYAGWFIDDFNIFQASTAGNTVRVPQLKSLPEYPSIYNYPNCTDVKIVAQIQFLQSAPPPVTDSIYVEYLLGAQFTPSKVTMIYDATVNPPVYVGYIPFCGFDTVTKWRIVMNDEKYNRLTYPFVLGTWNEFRSVRGYVGEQPMQTTGLSSQELMLKTNAVRAMYQFRYRASELRALGITPGKISGLGYNVTQATSGYTMLGFNTYVGNIDSSYQLSSSVIYTGDMTQVIGANGFNLVSPSVGWQDLTFDRFFLWDGVSDLLIRTCWDNPNGATGGTTKIESIVAPGATGTSGSPTYIPSAVTGQFYVTSGYVGSCTSPFNVADGQIAYRPNFKFKFVRDCQLAIDAGIDSVLQTPSNYIVQANTSVTPFVVKIDNYGSLPLNTVRVKYKIDNLAIQDAGLWTGFIPPLGNTNYQFINSNTPSFTPGYRYMKVWSEILPPDIDWEPNNDTAFFEIVSCNGPMNGEYAIGNVTGVTADRKFNSFKEVFKMLQGCGVSGPVTFKVLNLPIGQYYTDTLSFPTTIAGASTINYIKFVSVSTTSSVNIKPIKVVNSNIDLSGCKYYKFENISFYSADACVNDTICGQANLIQMSNTTSNIEFKKCSFVKNPNGLRPTYFVNIGSANNITLDSCKFDGDASSQVYIKGSSTNNLCNNNIIKNSTFINNLETAIYAEYSQNITIDKNTFRNNRTISAGSIYNVLIQHSKDFQITKNLFELNNVSAINVTDILTSVNSSIIANNKISVHNGNPTISTAHVYGINAISGDNLLIAYNNIYARDLGYSKVAYGMSLGYSEQSLTNVRIKNNIIVSDGYGYAVYANPTTQTSLDFSNNIYWKLGTMVSTPSTILWKYNTTNCTTLASWQTALGNGDQNSYVENPIFAAWNLLNTSNTFLCYKGTQLTEVTNDFNYTPRPTIDNPCIGAVQFNPPPSNIFVQKVWIERGEESIAADGKTRYSACGLGNEYLNIRFTNISSNSIPANNLQCWFKVDNLTVTTSQKDTIHFIVQPNTVYDYQFRLPYNFDVTTTADRDFKITAFSILTADTVHSNDTAGCYILSRQQLTALPAINNTINYGDSIQLSVTSNDSIYWFLNTSDATPVKKSHFYQTSRLFNDTTFYFSRKEEIPLLKISEIQISKTSTAAGLTANLPSWATATNTIEISNYGNGAVNLKGYQLAYFIGTIGATDTLNSNTTKSVIFSDYILPANKSVVLQIAAGASSDSSQYINIGTGTSFSANSKVGFILKDTTSHTIIDAVTINDAKFNLNTNIPSTIWTGRGITIPSGVAGFIRTSNIAIDSNGWVASSATNLMTIGTLDSTQIWKSDNGCYGFMSPYNVHVSGIPSVDPGVASVELVGINESAVCTLTDEQIQVRVTNTGVQACTSTPLVLNVYDGTSLVTTLYDTCTTTIQPNDTVAFIFSNPVNLAANTANKIFTIKCFSNLASDVIHLNDTSYMQITSLKTPLSPLSSGVTIPYASSTILTSATSDGNTNDALIWYNSPISLVELDRINYTTPILYTTDTFYVGTMLIAYDTIQVGTGVTYSSSYPCPLNPNNKNVKEQYLFKASELAALGFSDGNINSLMFNIYSVSAATTLSNYTIKIGTTNQEALTTWQYGLNEVYFDTLNISNGSDQLGWKTFPFSEPFYYDGQSNIVVEICFTGITPNTQTVKTYYTTTNFNSVISYHNSTINACSWTGAPTNGSNTNRPNIRFDIDKFGCSSVRTPVVVTVGDPPSCDASITQMISPASTTVMSGISIPIQVELKNYGTAPLTSADIAWVVNGIIQTTFNWTGNLASGASTTVTIGNKTFVSGNNNITAWSILACDTINSNDTTSFNFSSCIGNNTTTSHLTIGGATADFPTISSAVTALVNSGICGDVVFDINPINNGYNEQVFIPSIIGTENGSTITFRGNATDSNSVVLKYNAGSNIDQFALKLDGASNIRFENLRFENYDSTYSSIVEIANASSNIKFESVVIKSNPLANPAQEVAKLINIDGANNNLLFNKVYFSGGATGINANLPTDTISNYITVTNSFFNYFAFNGINIDGANNINIENNKFREYANGNISKAIYTSNLYGLIQILSNNIYLEGSTANVVRIGIDVRKVYASVFTPALIANNSISLSGTYSTGALAYIGMNLDTLNNGNIYYNTIRVRASNNSNASKALNIGGACSNIKVLNNNLENAGKGFAYYVNAPTTQVTLSNNNNYNTNGVAPIYWSGNKATLALLQAANSQDNLSIISSNPFINDSLLSPSYPSEIVRSGEPLDDVTSDILGNYRPISPKPTIGAYEYQFTSIDCGPIRILSPLKTIKYIENLPLNVQVRVKNFGLFAMDSVKITAVLKYNADTTNFIQTVSQSFLFNLNSLDSADFTITDPLFPPLHFRSVNDSLNLCVYTTLNGDTIQINDTIRTNFLTIPGYNIQTIRTEPITERCQLYTTPIKMVIKNIGENTILPTDSIWLGYQVVGRPDLEVRELLQLPYTDENGTYTSIPKNGQITYTFQQTANFYPLGLVNTTWSLRTYASFTKDNVKVNDTSAYITVNSNVSPPAPITYDTSIYYGTWAEPWATQINSYPIKWYADSNLADPFYAPNTYAASTKYRTTQLFTDSTFYLRVNLSGSYPCKSQFTPIHVTMLDRNPVDGACIGLSGQGVVEPPEEGWVYMTAADTIKVKVSNYGLMDMQNFNISYSIQQTSPNTSPITTVTEYCSLTIQPNGSKIYKFDSLADFSNPAKTYKIRTWIDVPGDATALNDTSRYWFVRPINGTSIYPPSAGTSSSLDITRVQISNMDNSSNSSGIAYTNFTESVPPIVLFKGIYDSIYIQCDKPSSIEDTSKIGGWVRVFIDWDRNGVFDGSEEVFNDTIVSGLIAKGKINVPSNLISGHSRMRIILWQGRDSTPFTANESPTGGEVEDYKVLVRDTWDVNAELMKFTEPLELLHNQKNNVRVILRNTGKTLLSNATIHWTNNDGNEQIFNWSGGLAPAARTEVRLADSIIIPTGMNNLKAWVDATGDPYHINDTIRRSAYIYKTYIIPYYCQFDTTGYDDFYAFNSNPQLPTNCWEFGTPDSSNITIKGPYSTPNCWKTKLLGKYPINNESILYSPIFDKGIVLPDTLSFMMRRDLASGSYMFIEYKNWNNEWKRLGARDDGWGQNWYDDDSNRFVNSKVWTETIYSLDHMLYNLGNTVQFRFIFHSGSSTKDGIAIDNIEIRRALREQDAGVVSLEITPTELPNYGSTYYPRVKIRNYGSEALTRFYACYTSQDMHIPQCEEIYDTVINPGDTFVYTFNQGRYVYTETSNPFNICAFTRLNPTDLYSDNDSIRRQVVIGPLQKDIALLDIVSPSTQIVSNNMIEVGIHIKNWGLDPVTTLPVGYHITGQNEVLETITFSPPLYNNEEYIYHFNTQYHSNYGASNLKVWTGLDGDYYHNNDTLYKRVNATTTTRDLEAKYITVDDYNSDYLGVQLTFANNSSEGVDHIKVGYYYNGDKTNAVEEIYRDNTILPSGELGHHYFTATLPRANSPYQGICGYVIIDNDNNRENDTTCTLYMGVRDVKSDTIYVEQTSSILSKVQLTARNIGTIGGPITVNAGYVINGNWLNPVIQPFNWQFNEPNSHIINYLTFNQRIPRNDDRIYDIVAWVDYQFDANRSNDTTMIYKVVDYIGLDGVEETNQFTLNQNVPNPLTNSTTITFNLPEAGNTRFFIVNNMGQLIKNENKFYTEGKHEIQLNNLNLTQGIYYYTMEFEGKRLMKKMIIAR